MKAALIFLSLIFSANAFALVCESEDNLAKKLVINTHHSGDLASGESFIRGTINVFAGSVKKQFFVGDTYTLYNQKGQQFTLFVKKQPVIQHCRTRVCPPPSTPNEPLQAKLSSEGIEDEYFSCF